MKQFNIEEEVYLKCEIETKQFLGSAERWKLHRQEGVFNKNTLKFTPLSQLNKIGSRVNGDHVVQFSSLQSFGECLVRYLV